MATVGVSLSFTFRIGDSGTNQFAKVSLDIGGVDTELPIGPQIEKSNAAINEIWNAIYKAADDKIQKIFDMKGA